MLLLQMQSVHPENYNHQTAYRFKCQAINPIKIILAVRIHIHLLETRTQAFKDH